MEPDEIIKHLEDIKRCDLTAVTKLATFYENYPSNDDLSFYLRIILREFAQMFSFEPGQIKGLDPLIGLTKWLKENHGRKNHHMYYTEYWQQLLDLRSSFHLVEVKTCADCNAEYGYAGIGSFADLAGFNCSSCDGMYIGSSDEIGKEIVCAKSRSMVFDKCPKCLSTKVKSQIVISGYEYFYERKFITDISKCCLLV